MHARALPQYFPPLSYRSQGARSFPAYYVPVPGLGRARYLAEGDFQLPEPIRSNPRRWEAYALVGAAVASASAIILQYRGHHALAAALSVCAVLGGASIAAIRLLGEPEPQLAQQTQQTQAQQVFVPPSDVAAF